jgi:tRNA-2-methylthio-N6-dimethylallyladenosine synthase
MLSAYKKYYLKTFGCQMNVYDGMRIAGMLSAAGMEKTDCVQDADVLILNTCSVREKATNKVFSALGRIRDAKKPGSIFGIVGCVAREAGVDAMRRIPELNFVLGPQSYHRLPIVLENPDAKYLHVDLSGLEKFDELPKMTASGPAAYVPIQEGCSHCCAYCIVPFTRGAELSRPFDDVLAEARLAAGQGAIEICFLGQNVNGYGHNLAALICEVAKIDEVKRIRYTSSHPSEMTDELIALHGTEPKLLPFLNLPLQSGSPKVLRAMRRPSDLESYLTTIEKLCRARSDIKIGSDFIVGFPGETNSDFEQTCDVARRVGFINSYSFKYSKRPHTAAATMPDQVPDSVKRERLKILDNIINENMRAFNESCVGKTFDCLIESADKNGNAIYRTPYMQQVIADTRGADFCKIKITSGNKCSLRGGICRP